MPSWSSPIFDDDVAADTRDIYRELLLDGVPDDEATERVLATFEEVDDEEQPCLWLALAAAQHLTGRLHERVRQRALEIIDTEAGSINGARERRARATLRDQLTGPQPERKRLRRATQVTTDLEVGDVLGLTAPNGATGLLRVLRIERDRSGSVPILGWVDAATEGAPIRPDTGLFLFADDSSPRVQRPAVFSVHRLAKRDPDWRDVGFERVSRVESAPGDATGGPWYGLGWDQLAEDLTRFLS